MSETDWHKIQRKLEGRCYFCDGLLPKHKGVCPVEGEEMMKRLDIIDDQVKHISDISEEVIQKFRDTNV